MQRRDCYGLILSPSSFDFCTTLSVSSLGLVSCSGSGMKLGFFPDLTFEFRLNEVFTCLLPDS